MKTRDELITQDVIDVCEQLDGGLVTVTEAVTILLSLDCILVTVTQGCYTISCYSDSVACQEMPLEEFEFATMPEHYTVNV